MIEHKIPIKEGELKVDQNALFTGFQKDLDDTKEVMRAVVIILLVMVGAMIFSLQIAIWQTKQPNVINITIPNKE